MSFIRKVRFQNYQYSLFIGAISEFIYSLNSRSQATSFSSLLITEAILIITTRFPFIFCQSIRSLLVFTNSNLIP